MSNWTTFDWLIIIATILGTVTALLFIFYAFFRLKSMIRDDKLEAERRQEIKKLRANARERIVLFLERNKIESLVKSSPPQNKNIATWRAELIHTVRAEFNHNLTQQLYLSESSWQIFCLFVERHISYIISVDRENKSKTSVELMQLLLADYPKEYRQLSRNVVETLRQSL